MSIVRPKKVPLPTEVQPGTASDVVVVARTRALQADPVEAVRGQGSEDEGEPLAEAADDDRVGRISTAGTDPPVVPREHHPQVVVTLGDAVAEVGRRQCLGDVAQRPQPVTPREGLQVGDAVAEVDDGRGR